MQRNGRSSRVDMENLFPPSADGSRSAREPMAKFVAGCVAGSIITLVILTLFGGLLYSRAERQLIDDWRKIHPGMTRASVLEVLGKPSYDMNPGHGFPEWANKSVPDNYYETHGLLVFTIPAPGPQLLLVYFDSSDCVSFVSSIYT